MQLSLDARCGFSIHTWRMAEFSVEGLVKVDAGHWVVWSASGALAVEDFGHIGEGMLRFSAIVIAESESEALAEFVSTYFPMSEAGPEVFDEVLIRSQ